jgi:hypothetical protein
MLNAFGTSWSMIKASFKVLQSDKELIFFPIMSAVAMLILTAMFAIPMFMGGFLEVVSARGMQFVDYLVLFLFYLLQYLIIFLSNTALVAAAMIRLRGGDPTIMDGLRVAFDRIVPIFLYALIAATVGMLLSAAKREGKVLTNIVVSLIGFVWTVATFLVVPILAMEDVGPIEAIKRSVQYLKKTWGEQLVGSFSISAVFNLAIFMVIMLTALVIFLGTQMTAAIWPLVIIGLGAFLVILLISLASTTLNGIYTAAVYQYVITGDAGSNFDNAVIQQAFRPMGKTQL